MAKRQRIDSAASQAKLLSTVGKIDPPAHISVPAGARPFWDAIVRARPREDWDAAPSLMNAAANLAWTQWQIDQCRRMIDAPDMIPEGSSAAQLASHLLKMQRLEMGYLRTLQQHGRAVGGEARDVAKRAASMAGALAAASFADDDDLIARPMQ